ncbi:hypothetical protein QJS66_07570 [Kocuria rhizophila]|nr:hypothetical protein QJS66_07570 [Kocuria rhizophila]
MSVTLLGAGLNLAPARGVGPPTTASATAGTDAATRPHYGETRSRRGGSGVKRRATPARSRRFLGRLLGASHSARDVCDGGPRSEVTAAPPAVSVAIPCGRDADPPPQLAAGAAARTGLRRCSWSTTAGGALDHLVDDHPATSPCPLRVVEATERQGLLLRAQRGRGAGTFRAADVLRRGRRGLRAWSAGGSGRSRSRPCGPGGHSLRRPRLPGWSRTGAAARRP